MLDAVPSPGPALLIELHVLIAGVLLLALLHLTGGTSRTRACVFVGAVGLALSFVRATEARIVIGHL